MRLLRFCPAQSLTQSLILPDEPFALVKHHAQAFDFKLLILTRGTIAQPAPRRRAPLSDLASEQASDMLKGIDGFPAQTAEWGVPGEECHHRPAQNNPKKNTPGHEVRSSSRHS